MNMKKQFSLSSVHLLIIITITLKLSGLILSAGTVDFKLTDLDSAPLDLTWCGSSRETVLVLTEKNSLYRSDDKGFTFRKLNDVLLHTGKTQLEEDDNEIGRVSRLIQSPVDKSLMIFLGTHGINWIGEDCGRKIRALNHGRKVQEYIFHPTERNWGLASAYTLCEDFERGEPCKVYKELFVTRDLGENWDQLGSYVVQFGWGIVDENHLKTIPKERILLTLEQRGKGDQKSHGWSYKIDFIYSDDFFKTKRIGTHKGNKFLLTKNYLFVAQLVDQERQEVMLLSASSHEKVYNFQQIETNSKRFLEHSYTFLDTSDISVFLNMNHFGENSRYGHIYTSDDTGTKYSLSLKYNIRSTDHSCDFQKIFSIEGSHIANTIDEEYMKSAEQELEEEILEADTMESKPVVGGKSANKIEDSFRNFIMTRITFNKGSIWKRLTAPDRDILGKKYDCEPPCYLNLHGVTGDFPTFYSVESAAGIIIGNGNVGKYLSHDSDQISTYLSRDGGMNWFEVRKGSHIYEIGDHGALIVIADEHSPTDTVFYSWDEGLTWQELRISNEKIMVKNIIIEPSSTSQHFVIYGERQKKDEKIGAIIGLNFSSLHEPQCRNPDQPGTENSDYELWTPTDNLNHECIMGKKVIYTRRKRDAQCFNGETFERKVEVQHCDCTEADYECDVGYARSHAEGPCSQINPQSSDAFEIPLDCNGSYTVSKGYRKIPGNVCTNGIKFDPFVVYCPNKFFAVVGKALIALLIVIIIVVAIMTLCGSSSSSFTGNVKDYVKNKLDTGSMRKPEYVDIEADGDGETLFDENDMFDSTIKVEEIKKTKNKSKNKEMDSRGEKNDNTLINLDSVVKK